MTGPTQIPCSPEYRALIERAVRPILEADSLLVCAGAGMGVDSGLPDFRGRQGFWKAYPPLAQARLRFEQIANPAAFDANPRLAWGFYGHRLQLYRRTRPHAGFAILRSIGERLSNGAAVFTSNIDGQFQRAGFALERIAECHGSIHWLQCARPCGAQIWPADDFDPQIDESRCLLESDLPKCPNRGGLARPNILMFGDGAWISRASDAQSKSLDRWMACASRMVTIELGAGTTIPTVRMFAEQSGGTLIRLNPTEPCVSGSRDIGIASGALAGLLAISDCLQREGFTGRSQ